MSKGKAGSVREQVESWKVRGKIGRVGNLAKSRGLWYGMVLVDFCALGGRCARGHWHTGKRKGEGEGGKAKILGFGPWSLVLLQDPAARRATAAATRSAIAGGMVSTKSRKRWATDRERSGPDRGGRNFERFLSTQKRSFGRSVTQLCHTRGWCPARGWRHF